MSEVSNTPSVPYWEQICEHGKSFAAHCNECEIRGYCGCPKCVDADTLVVIGDPRYAPKSRHGAEGGGDSSTVDPRHFPGELGS